MRQKAKLPTGKKKKRNPLAKSAQSPSRRDFIDYDYVSKLSKEEREFLGKFTDEYYGGYGFNKNKYGEYEGNIHQPTDLRRECYRRNRAQRLDMFSYAKHGNKLQNVEDTEILVEDWFETIEIFKQLEELEEQSEQADQAAQNIKGSSDKTDL